MSACPHCAAEIEDGAKFCETCGKQIDAAVVSTGSTDEEASGLAAEATPFEDLGSGPISAPTKITPLTPAEPKLAARIPCVDCGGEVGADGYCEQCGTKAASERDHFREDPADWVAGVCDRGIRHHRNEDAMALLASPTPGERAVLVVLDGVSNTDRSDEGSLAGARAAREVLRTPLPKGMGTPQSREAAVAKVLADAVTAANDAVVSFTPEGSTAPPSATFVCGILEGTTLTVANVGDSRAYWVPDAGGAQQLSVDDSSAQEQMAAGIAREVAENSPTAHSITRWLGQDAPDLTPRIKEIQVTEPGWVAVVSDGLWNYASTPEELAAQIVAAGSVVPSEIAIALVKFANGRGGQDNITATLARVGGAPAATPAPVQNGAQPEQQGEHLDG